MNGRGEEYIESSNNNNIINTKLPLELCYKNHAFVGQKKKFSKFSYCKKYDYVGTYTHSKRSFASGAVATRDRL